MVLTISLYALQYWATRNYYIDYNANVDKIAIRGHNAISSSNPDTRTLFQCTKSISKPMSGPQKPSALSLVQLPFPALRSRNVGLIISESFPRQ